MLLEKERLIRAENFVLSLACERSLTESNEYSFLFSL